MQTNDPTSAILLASKEYDITILGATSFSVNSSEGLGRVAESILRERSKGLLIVKVFRPKSMDMESEFVGQTAISVLVDKWFAENTYNANEFSDLNELLALKEKQKVTVSLALPALNEEGTVGEVIRAAKRELMERVPLLDEIVLINSNSKDRTREIAQELGIPVFIHQEILSQYGARIGKGEALWKSLYVTHGDIVLWIDTDIVNIHPRFLYGLLGPLLLRPDMLFVKGFYRRPITLNGKNEIDWRWTRHGADRASAFEPVLPRALRCHSATLRRVRRAQVGAGADAIFLRLWRGDWLVNRHLRKVRLECHRPGGLAGTRPS